MLPTAEDAVSTRRASTLREVTDATVLTDFRATATTVTCWNLQVHLSHTIVVVVYA